MLFICPAHNGTCGEGVTLDLGGFASTEATIGACSAMRERGVESYTVRKSEAIALRPFQAEAVRHSTGLVCIGS